MPNPSETISNILREVDTEIHDTLKLQNESSGTKQVREQGKESGLRIARDILLEELHSPPDEPPTSHKEVKKRMACNWTVWKAATLLDSTADQNYAFGEGQLHDKEASEYLSGVMADLGATCDINHDDVVELVHLVEDGRFTEARNQTRNLLYKRVYEASSPDERVL